MSKFCGECGTQLAIGTDEGTDVVEIEEKPRVRYQTILARLGSPAGKLDDRTISEVTWAELPLSLYAQTSNSQGHDDAEIVGNIDKIWVDGELAYASGLFSNSDKGQEALENVREENLLGVSIDIRDGDLDLVEHEDGSTGFVWVTAHIGAATMVGKPAFEEARIQLLDGKVLKASVGPHLYEKRMFAKKNYSKAERINIAQDGEISGHIVQWGIAHRGFGNRKVVLNPSGGSLRDFNIGRANFEEGGSVASGVLTSDGLHAPDELLGANTNEKRAMSVQAFVTSENDRYENVRCQFAQVVAWEDEFGIAIHGCLLPDVSVESATRALAGCSSIDYRNDLFMGAHFVNTCGYLPPAIDEDEDLSKRLVASAKPENQDGDCTDCGKETTPTKSETVKLANIRKDREELAKVDAMMARAEMASILASKRKKL